MAVVKADAYGHGAVPVARAALEAGATWCGVALVEEGLELRAAGIEAPILVLSEFPPGAEAVALAHRLTPSLYSSDGSGALRARRPRAGRRAREGRHRHAPRRRVASRGPRPRTCGRSPRPDCGSRASGRTWPRVRTTPRRPGHSLPGSTPRSTAAAAAGFVPTLRHAANSGGVLRHPEAVYDLVRPGIALFGIAPGPGVEADLRPALTWRSSVAFARRLAKGERLSYGHRYELARDAMVATVPVGYADGYPRALSSKADVLIRGRRCRVAGNVTMDQLLVDCGDLDVARRRRGGAPGQPGRRGGDRLGTGAASPRRSRTRSSRGSASACRASTPGDGA